MGHFCSIVDCVQTKGGGGIDRSAPCKYVTGLEPFPRHVAQSDSVTSSDESSRFLGQF